jgi:predicted lipase
MPLQLFEDAMGDPRNARFLAAAADLAYYSQAEGESKFRDELGLAGRLVSVDNTQAWIATNDDHIVVAFRGTEKPTAIEGLKDWLLTNAMNLLVVPEGRLGTDLAAAGVGARFHQGFVEAIAEIWPAVLSGVEEEMAKAERPLWVTGHSLGGALALFAAWLFTRKMINVHQIYTFGAPMIGNQVAIDAFNREFKGKLFRYTNQPDPVPRLPMYSLLANEFVHCEEERLLDTGAENPTDSLVKNMAKDAVEKVLSISLVDNIWNSVVGGIAAHGMDNYRKLLG